MKTKRHFILLEIIIAITLLMLSFTFLIRNPIKIFQKEINELKHIREVEIKKNALIKLKKMLYKNKIPFKEINCRNKKNAKPKKLYIDQSLKKSSISESSIGDRSVNDRSFSKNLYAIPKIIYYRIWIKNIKKGPKENSYYILFAIETTFDKKYFNKSKNLLKKNELMRLTVFSILYSNKNQKDS